MDMSKSPGPLMQGPLSRRLMGGMKSKKKYFVLTARRLQSYKSQQDYENVSIEETKHAVGFGSNRIYRGIFQDCIDLMELQTARALTSQGSAKNAFEVVTRSKSFVFQATAPEQTTKWIDALNKVMTLKFSVAGELPEEREETIRIEQELQKRKSLKFWRNSRTSSSQQSEEEEALNSYGFLEDQDVEGDEGSTDDVFSKEENVTPEPRPTSVTSSGVESTSVDESPEPDYDVPSARAQRVNEEEEEEDQGIYDVPPARAHKMSEDEGIDDTNDGGGEPLYQNFSSEIPSKISTPAINELRKMVGYETRSEDTEGGLTTTELKGIEQLRELLATMP